MEYHITNIIRISSFGIDSRSGLYSPSVNQGVLGDAHVCIEAYLMNTCKLNVYSVRPTSFFSNIEYNKNELFETGECSVV